MRAFLACLLLLAIPGCDAVRDITDPSDDPAVVDGMALAATESATVPYVLVHEDGEMMAVEVDPASGALTRAAMIAQNGAQFVVAFGPDGMPTRMVVGEMIFVIANVRSGLADLVAIRPDGSSTVFRDVAIDEAAAADLRAFAAAARRGQVPSASELFNAAALGIGVTGCTMAGAGVFALAVGVTGPLAPSISLASGTACVGTMISVYRERRARNGGVPPLLEEANTGFAPVAAWANYVSCVAGDRRACIELTAAATSLALTEAEQTEQTLARPVADAEAVLAGGGGSVQISLTWDTTADLDLWVTDPAGERIYYGNRSSATGGVLDVDDTDGFGPENIYWPTNDAPVGTYTVQVDHFRGASPSPWRVTIVLSGRTQTFSGSVSTNETDTVTTFTVGSTRTAPHPLAAPPAVK